MSVAPATMLSTSDLAWLRVQTPANLSLSAVTLLAGDRLPARCVRSRLEDRLMIHQRFRQRIESPHLPLARPRWRECDDFRLADHFVELELPAGEEEAALDALVDRLRSEPLDESRPLWQVHLTHLQSGRSALILRVHAALADCTSVPQLALQLTDDPSAISYSQRLGLEPLDSPEEILERAGTGPTATRTLCRLITSRADRGNPLRSRPGSAKVTAWSEPIDLGPTFGRAQELRRPPIDFVIAAVTGGLRRTLHRQDWPAEDVNLKAVVPWSLRRAGDTPTGSCLAMALIKLPVGAPTAADRLAEVRHQVERLLLAPEGLVVLGADPFQGLSMTEVEERSLRLLGEKATVMLGVFEAPASACRLCGQKVEALRWSPTLSGDTALAIGVVDYAGSVAFGVVCDRQLTVDAHRLAADMATALQRL